MDAKYNQMVIDDKIHHDQILALKDSLSRALSGSPDCSLLIEDEKVKDEKIASLEIENAGYCSEIKALKKGMKMMEKLVKLFRTRRKIKKHKHWDFAKCDKSISSEKI
jgi:hypothetical protein